MILAFDVGNSNIVFGGIENFKTTFVTRLTTDTGKTEDEYSVIIKNLIEINKCSIKDFDGSIISSVVPPLNNVLKAAIQKIINKTPLIVSPGIKTGLNIKIDNPAQLGSDMVVGAVAAIAEYPKPLIVIDMGTATTLCVIDKNCDYRGGIICPGVKVSLDSLTSKAAQLYGISLEAPKKVIGTNTVDCMRSGTIFGNAAMIDGLIDRMIAEIGSNATVIATGGLSSKIIRYCKHKIIYDSNLLLKGLEIIYYKNI